MTVGVELCEGEGGLLMKFLVLLYPNCTDRLCVCVCINCMCDLSKISRADTCSPNACAAQSQRPLQWTRRATRGAADQRVNQRWRHCHQTDRQADRRTNRQGPSVRSGELVTKPVKTESQYKSSQFDIIVR